ncbi:MAG: hydantoinase/oxoprolinase family protein [Stellaceae bacterium]
MKSHRFAVDIGGTFTDIFIIDEHTGEIDIRKVPSIPEDPSESILSGLDKAGVAPNRIRLFSHGTTVGTNALITRTFPKAALVTTKGFRDVLEIRDSTKTELWDAYWDMPPPYIRRRDRFEVNERIDYRGDVVTPLDEDEVREVARILRRREVATVAVCLFNAYANGVHERHIKEILQIELPGVPVTISSEILPELGEFPRTSTTVINAILAPVVGKYMRRLTVKLKDKGYDGPVLVLHSGGGVMTAEAAVGYSARLAASGLAGGAVAMSDIAKRCGFENAIGVDIGGTSADVSIMHDGEVRVTQDWSVEPGHPIRFPSIELISIGAGGGSIAWMDDGGSLRSGPKSAGARPGPACYLNGGCEPTNTDANLVLGRLGSSLIGGQMTLNIAAAEAAIMQRVATPLGIDLTTAAAAIIRVANANITDAVRLVSVQKGYDPRDFALVAFGGAGPLHAATVARELSIPTVIIPLHPGITSAMGCALVDVRHDVTRTLVVSANESGFEELLAMLEDAEVQLRSLLDSENILAVDREFHRYVTMRYVGQWRSLVVQCPSEASLAELLASFHRQHEREYAYTQPAQPVEIFGARATGIGRLPKPRLPMLARANGPPSAKMRRPAYFDAVGSFVETPVFARHDLKAGHEFDGPAIVEQLDSTVVIPPDFHAVIESHGNIILTVKAN